MDSHLIYTVFNSIKSKATWLKATSDTEWIYVGSGAEINNGLVIETINNYFLADDSLYIILTRNDSIKETKENIEKVISQLLTNDRLSICDIGFDKVIEFNAIGTMRCGRLKKN